MAAAGGNGVGCGYGGNRKLSPRLRR